MTSLFGMLRTGARGMNTSQNGLAVTSSNVSNATTQGYSRRVLNGDGTTLGGNPRRVIDSFVERRVLGARANASEASAERLSSASLDEIFADTEGGLGPSLDAFLSAMQDFAAQPAEASTRGVTVQRAGQLGDAFRQASDNIQAARKGANDRIAYGVEQVNARLDQIGKLGQAIQRAELDGSEASDLRDQRDQLVREVSDYVPVSIINGADGSQTLTLGGGQPLVTGDGQVNKLVAQADANGDVQVFKKAAGQLIDVSSNLETGEIRGHMTARDVNLKNAAGKLDQLAHDIASSYNAVHSEGVGADGVGGRALFEDPGDVVGAASRFRISEEIAGDPQKLAAADSQASLPSGNAIAKRMQALASVPIAFGGGMTATEALASLVGSVGVALQSAQSRESMAVATASQVESLRESVSSVSSDEEMVKMMQYQRSYEASLKVVQVADELLEQLVNLKR